MKPCGIPLVWIVVADIQTAIEFYTSTLGFVLEEFHKEFGWAELSGGNGSRLGIAQYTSTSEIPAGHNAVITIEVEDLELSREELLTKKARCVGDILVVPGHAKMQSFLDNDGNMLQLVQVLK